MFKHPEYDPAIVHRALDAEAENCRAQRALSEHVMELSPFNRDDVVRDKDTGNRYRVEGGNGYIGHSNRPQMLLRCRRVYQTGRRDASSTTYLSPNNLELVEKADAPEA